MRLVFPGFTRLVRRSFDDVLDDFSVGGVNADLVHLAAAFYVKRIAKAAAAALLLQFPVLDGSRLRAKGDDARRVDRDFGLGGKLGVAVRRRLAAVCYDRSERAFSPLDPTFRRPGSPSIGNTILTSSPG